MRLAPAGKLTCAPLARFSWPFGVHYGMKCAFGMRHQAEDRACGVTDARDIGERAVQVPGIGGVVPLGIDVAKDDLVVLLQESEISVPRTVIEIELALSVRARDPEYAVFRYAAGEDAGSVILVLDQGGSAFEASRIVPQLAAHRARRGRQTRAAAPSRPIPESRCRSREWVSPRV